MNRRRKYVLEVDRAKMYKTPGIGDILDAMSTGEGKRP